MKNIAGNNNDDNDNNTTMLSSWQSHCRSSIGLFHKIRLRGGYRPMRPTWTMSRPMKPAIIQIH